MSHSSPTIAHIQTIPYRLPLHGSLRWGKASVIHDVHHVLVRVTLSDDSVGMAEAPPRPTIYGETIHSIATIIEHELAPRLVGLPADGPLPLHEIKNNQTAKGAIDIAVHDALAQHKGISLADYLGVSAENIKVSYILGIGDHDTMLAEAEKVFAQGVRVLKVKVGRNWEQDIARIVALQDSFGDEMAIYTDANECFSPDEAPAKLSQLAEMGVLYCEEPLPIELIRERATIRAGEHMPLIGDDSTFSLRDLRRELALNTFDILNIKTARTGYTESRQMLALAREAGKGVMVGSQACSGLGTARAGLFAALQGIDHPSELSFFLKLKEEIIAAPIKIENGFVKVADLVNVRIDPDLLRDAATG